MRVQTEHYFHGNHTFNVGYDNFADFAVWYQQMTGYRSIIVDGHVLLERGLINTCAWKRLKAWVGEKK